VHSGGELHLEPGFAGIATALAEMHHPVRVVRGMDREVFGRAQIIRKECTGLWAAGSDGRGDGGAMGW
jgi:gamma-glutamyltranspeptidase